MNDYIKLVMCLSIVAGAIIFIFLITFCTDIDWRNCRFDPYRNARNTNNENNENRVNTVNRETIENNVEIDLEENLITEPTIEPNSLYVPQ